MTNEIELLCFALEIAVIFITNNRFFGGKKCVEKFTTCSVRDQPEVWEWVLNMQDFIFFGLKFFSIWRAHSLRAALIFAISM